MARIALISDSTSFFFYILLFLIFFFFRLPNLLFPFHPRFGLILIYLGCWPVMLKGHHTPTRLVTSKGEQLGGQSAPGLTGMGNAEYLHTARAPWQARQLVPLDGSQRMLRKLRKHNNFVGHWGAIEFFMVPVGAMQCLNESVLGVLQNSFVFLGQFSHPLDRPGALKPPQQHSVSESVVPKVWLDQQHQLHQGICWICRFTSPTQNYWVWRWSLIIQVFTRPLRNSACRFKCENLWSK